MPVKIIAPKVQDVSKISSEDIVPAEVVDEFASVYFEHKEAKENIAPVAKAALKLEKGIIGAGDEVIDASIAFILTGNKYEVQLGAQGEKTAVTNNEDVIDEIGQELFNKLAKVSITDLKAYCTPDQLEKITKKTFAIKRRVKVELL